MFIDHKEFIFLTSCSCSLPALHRTLLQEVMFCFLWGTEKKLQLTLTTWASADGNTPYQHFPPPFPALKAVITVGIKHTLQHTTLISHNQELARFFFSSILWHHWDTHDMTLPRIQWDTQSTFPENRFKPVDYCVCEGVCETVSVCVCLTERGWSWF